MTAAERGSRLGFHLRHALRDVRRNPGLSLAIFVGLALSCAIWTTANCHALRTSAPPLDLDPDLHHVELRHGRTPPDMGRHAWNPTGMLPSRSRVSFPEWQVLSASKIPAREAYSYRSLLLVSGSAEDAPRSVPARLTGGDFFNLFELELRHGRGFEAAEAARLEPVAVLGRRLNAQLFDGEDSVGRQILVEGHVFRVVGVLAHEQPHKPVWDPADSGARQDAIYLPFPWGQRLLARPEHPLPEGPVGDTFPELLASPTLAVAYWAELPTTESRQAYAAHLDRNFTTAEGPRYRLRSYSEWQYIFHVPFGDVQFYTLITGLMLLAAGLNTTRLLLAKGVAQREEVSIHRALGATRGQVFSRQMLAALLVVLPAAVVGILLAIPYLELFNVLVKSNDIPVRLTGAGLVRGLGATVLVGLAAAIHPAWILARTVSLTPGWPRRRGLLA